MLNPSENRKIWMKDVEANRELMEGRVKEDIERYRKGWCKLRFVDGEGNPLKHYKVELNQISHDFGFGANLFMLDEFEQQEYNDTYRELFKDYFNLATIPFYWDTLEPEKGKPRYDKNSPKVYRRPAPELCMEYCEENGVTPKLHCLIYDKFMPKWLPLQDMKAMEGWYEERFRQISERFSGRMLEFEVINEILCFYDYKSVIPQKHDLVEWCFDLARKHFPDETLVINEGNPLLALADQGYRNPYFMLIEKALNNGASIDKIGLQHHVFTGVCSVDDEDYERTVKSGDPSFNPEKILRGLDKIAEFGLPLEITEVTVPTFGDTPEDEELQADLLETLYRVWFSHPAVTDVVYWNLPDGYAFDDKSGRLWNENKCRGGLFHHDLTPKKAALRLKKLLQEEWHTQLELETDENGYVEFRGFYGDYTAAGNLFAAEFGIHKGDASVTEIQIKK